MNADILIRRAREVAKNAYCPYSKFHVGCSILCEGDEFVDGCNVENASYGLTICSERNALFAAVARGLKPIELAVTCPSAGDDCPDQYVMPCGACRQVMAEFLDDDALIHVDGAGTFRLGDLIPKAFRI